MVEHGAFVSGPGSGSLYLVPVGLLGTGVLRAVVVAYAVGLFFANQLADPVVSMPFWLSLGCLPAVPPGRRPNAPAHREESRGHGPMTGGGGLGRNGYVFPRPAAHRPV